MSTNEPAGDKIHDLWQGAPKLYEVSPMSALRRDDGAVTLMDESGVTYLMPLQAHDYDASRRLHDLGVQIGEVVHDTFSQPVAVKYPASSDLVSLPSVLNASQGVDGGEADVEHVFDLSRELFETMHRRLDCVPSGVTIDVVAVDKERDRAELLPPYQVSSELSPRQALDSLVSNAQERAGTVDERDLLIHSLRNLRQEE